MQNHTLSNILASARRGLVASTGVELVWRGVGSRRRALLALVLVEHRLELVHLDLVVAGIGSVLVRDMCVVFCLREAVWE